MKILILLLFISMIFLSLNASAQDPCNNGDGGGNHGCPDCIVDPATGLLVRISVLAPVDPNEIIGPAGYDSTMKWVSSKATLPYKILFENDPKFATAAAQKVIIYMPIHPNLNPNALRLGDFGFGSFTFDVPVNTTAYTQRLNVKDSLGVFLDVTAGLDGVNRRAFWIFESIDPATGLSATLPATAGFLPVNDSTHKGEGFVTLTIQAGSNVITRDSILAQAFIIFDTNEPLATNIEHNLIDAVAPTSKVDPLPVLADTAFKVSWTGSDDTLGSGLQYFDLYYSKNNGPFALYQGKVDSGSIVFTGDRGASYSFYTLATDNTGNKEAAKTSGDQTVTIPSGGLYVSVKAYLQGAGLDTAGLMTDDLRKLKFLPTSEPYRSLGFTPVNNTATEIVKTGVLDSTSNKAITDWVWLELRDTTNPSEIIATRAALIRRDGNVVDIDGVSPVFFNKISPARYHLAIRHRNHLGIRTAAPVDFTSGEGSYNFTTSASQCFTNQIYPSTVQIGTVWAMRGGNSNFNNNVKYNGPFNDQNQILNLKLGGSIGRILHEYAAEDVNMNGNIKWNGPANDQNFLLNIVLGGSLGAIYNEQL